MKWKRNLKKHNRKRRKHNKYFLMLNCVEDEV